MTMVHRCFWEKEYCINNTEVSSLHPFPIFLLRHQKECPRQTILAIMAKGPWQHLLPTIPKSELCLEDEAAMVQQQEPEVERQMSHGLASLPGESTASSKWTQPKLNPEEVMPSNLCFPQSSDLSEHHHYLPSCPSPKSGKHTLVPIPCDSPHLINNRPMWWYFPNISKNPSSSLQPYGTTWFRLPPSRTFSFATASWLSP